MNNNYKTEKEALDAFVKNAAECPVEFEGNNCSDVNEDKCSGWYIGSRRCVCGNRRVELLVDGSASNGFYAYADAY